MAKYKRYDDPIDALEAAFALAKLGLMTFHPHYLAREAPGKSPTLRPEEVLQVFEYAESAAFGKGDHAFFRAEALVTGADWKGTGFVMWHIEEQWGEPWMVLVTTAYRKDVQS